MPSETQGCALCSAGKLLGAQMIKLNRKTEYALMAVQFLAQRDAERYTSVSEIARRCRIPEVLLAKVLQRLKRHQLLTSVQGANGGYAIRTAPRDVRFLDFLAVFEEQTALVECLAAEPVACALYDLCEIKDPLATLNDILTRQLRDLTLQDVLFPEGAEAQNFDSGATSDAAAASG